RSIPRVLDTLCSAPIIDEQADRARLTAFPLTFGPRLALLTNSLCGRRSNMTCVVRHLRPQRPRRWTGGGRGTTVDPHRGRRRRARSPTWWASSGAVVLLTVPPCA